MGDYMATQQFLKYIDESTSVLPPVLPLYSDPSIQLTKIEEHGKTQKGHYAAWFLPDQKTFYRLGPFDTKDNWRESIDSHLIPDDAVNFIGVEEALKKSSELPQLHIDKVGPDTEYGNLNEQDIMDILEGYRLFPTEEEIDEITDHQEKIWSLPNKDENTKARESLYGLLDTLDEIYHSNDTEEIKVLAVQEKLRYASLSKQRILNLKNAIHRCYTNVPDQPFTLDPNVFYLEKENRIVKVPKQVKESRRFFRKTTETILDFDKAEDLPQTAWVDYGNKIAVGLVSQLPKEDWKIVVKDRVMKSFR